ncbi:cellulose synthase A catalytic subunit 3 [UDP-forming]-like protein [Tanacetum coccineum]
MPKYQSREEMTGNNGNGEKDGQISLHYPMLSRNNYAAWAIKMRVFMQAQGVWDAVEPRTSNTVVEVKKDKMALAAIYQGIPEDLLLSLAEKKIAKEAWEALKTMFIGADRVKTARIQTLKAEFEAMNMKETEGVDEFAAKVTNIVSTMPTLGDNVDESYVVKKLLRAVSTKFLQIASTLKQFGDLDNMTVEERDTRRRQRENPNLNRIEEGLEDPENKAEEEVEVIVVVGLVEEEDHTTIKMEDVAYQVVKTKAKFNATIVRNMVTMQQNAQIQDEKETGNGVVDQSKLWYLDTGASNHMTGDKEKFCDLNETVQGYVKFGNETKVRIEGKGTIVFQCKNGEHQKLQEVYYIPDLCSNIISLGQLSECGDAFIK